MDIKDYKFGDEDVDIIAVYVSRDKNKVQVIFNHQTYGLDLYKGDAIALAKHFKLTVEDLK